jgi:hypothetical protein
MTVAQRDFPSAERLYLRWRLGAKGGGESVEPGEKPVGDEAEKERARGWAFVTREILVGPSTIALEGRPVDWGLWLDRGIQFRDLKCLSNFLRIFLKPVTFV